MQLVSRRTEWKRLDPFTVGALLTALLLSIAIAQQSVMVVAAAVVLAVTTLMPVEIGLGAFAVLVPFDYVLAIGHQDSAIRVTWVAGAFAGVVLLAYGIAEGRLRRPPPTALHWCLFLFWVGLSTVWSVDPVVSAKRLPTVLTLIALYLVIASFEIHPRELSRVLFLVVLGGAIGAVWLIHQFGHAGGLPGFAHYAAEGRGALVFGEWERDPNEFGASLVLPFCLAFAGLLSRGSAAKKTVLLIALTLIAGAILLTMSRGALVSLAVAVLVLLYRAGIRTRVLAALMLAAVPLLFLPNLFYQRLVQARFDRGTGRIDILYVGLEIIKHNPVVGTGMATFASVYDRYAGYAPVFHGYQRSPHNTYLEAWAETGIIGFVLLLAAVVSQLKTARAAAPRKGRSVDWSRVAIEAAYWSVLVSALGLGLEFNKLFWLIIMLLALVARPAPQSSLQVSESR